MAKVSESLWWDPFVDLFEELDRAPLSDDLPDNLVEKIKRNHTWFVVSISGFKPPNEASKKLLGSKELLLGPHLSVKAELRETALKVSQLADLDEVQSYILVDRSVGRTANVEYKELVHSVLLKYYLERQCLLKCIRRIFVHALYCIDAMGGEAMALIKADLQNKLISLVQDLLASAFSVKTSKSISLPASTSLINTLVRDMEFTILWVEEMLIEANLIFDILFLSFYDDFSPCTLDQWKSLSNLFRGMLGGPYDASKMAVSVEAMTSFYHLKAQLLFVLIETLDLENLIRKVHDEVPFSEASCAFSLSDIQEIDAEVSNFSEELERESGPLILAWAVHLCLVSSLLEGGSTDTLMDLDHISYVRRAFDRAPFDYLLEIIGSNTFKESDGPISGFLSIVRTLISAFIASYELSESMSDGYVSSILSILCHIYRGEESLCMQFWDKDNYVDGPIRSVLYMLEKEYPFQKLDFIRFLSAVCEGAWPAQCVYNYLEKMRGITTLYQMPSGTGDARNKDMVRLSSPIGVPGVESIVIPSGTRGFFLRAVDESLVLVHWEFPHSGVFLLLLNLAQGLHLNCHEESSHIMDLIYRMVSANKAICFSLLSTDSLLISSKAEAYNLASQLENDFTIDIVKLVCTSVLNLVQQGGNIGIIANSFGILAEMLKCMPSRVLDAALSSNIFSTEITGHPNGSWILSTGLVRLFFAACEESDGDCSSLTISVLDFISQLVEKGVTEYRIIAPLIMFSLQYMLVNHINWKYKNHSRWRTTLKVFELMKCCFRVLPSSHSLGRMVRDILLFDSAALNVIWRIMILSTEALDPQSYSGHSSELQDIEVVPLVLVGALDVIHHILNELPEETFSSLPPLFSLLLSPATKPMPFSSLAISLFSFSHNPVIQIASARMLSSLCVVASKFQSQLFEYANLVFDATQMKKIKTSICEALNEGVDQDDSSKIVVLDFLTNVASYQPALFSSLALESEPLEIKPKENETIKRGSKVVDMLLKFLDRSKYLINGKPHLLSSILGLLKALWDGGTQYIEILDILKTSTNFWENLLSCLSPSCDKSPLPEENSNKDGSCELSSRFSCQSAVLEIMANELFLDERILQGEKSEKSSDQSIKNVLRKFFSSHDTEELVKHYTACGYNIELLHRAKAAVSLCIVVLIEKISGGYTGNLSVSLVKRIEEIVHSLSDHPTFSEVLTREGNQTAAFSKIADYLQGKLKGHDIPSGPFLDLCTCLLDANLFRCKTVRKDSNDACIYDVSQSAGELGFDLWTHMSDWKGLVDIAEDMFVFMHSVNSLVLVEGSRLRALRAFIMALTVYKENGGGLVSEAFVMLGIKCVCKSIQATLDSIVSTTIINAEEESYMFGLLSTQTEFLLTLVKIEKVHLHAIPILTKVVVSGIKVLADIRSPGPALNKTIELFLMLQLDLLGTSTDRDDASEATLTELASISGLLSPLCKYSKNPELSNLALVCMDLIMKHNLVSPSISVPIVQNHLPVRDILQKIRNETISDSVSVSASVAFSFFLTLSKTKGGVQLLHTSHVLSFLNAFLGEGDPFLTKSVHLWSLGVAIITSVIHFASSDSCYSDIVEEAVLFLTEKAEVMSYYLSAPELPINDNKRPRPNNSRITLDALTLTKQCLSFVYTLSRYKVPLSISSGLMENVIHLLAFISKRSTKLPFCPPSCKEEVRLDKCTAVIKTKCGWFGLSAEPTRFTERVAVKIYKISLLVLSILCVQAEAAVKRAEEVGFVDPVNLPELPMPEILHALQDQAIAVVTEVLLDANKSKSLDMEVERVCVLLVEILDMSLYLELCVSYLCGVRPVLGRVEDFSREIKPMMHAIEHHKDFMAYRRSLKQIVALLYPELSYKGDLM